MHINNPLQDKKIDQEGVIYALIFVLYLIVIVLIFSYAINFLRNTVNDALATPTGTDMENKYAELDLANYSLIANKLGLQKSSPVVPVVIPIATSTEVIATTSIEIATTTTVSVPEVATTTVTTTPIVEVTPAAPTRPTIIITNSTTKSGLASDLKTKLSAAGYKILSTGNSRPSLVITTIKVKNSIAPDSAYLAEIKKIVKTSYDFVVVALDDKASSDIEVVIGGK